MSRFDEWLAANGKVRGYETAIDEIQWLREERQRLRITESERETLEWIASLRLSIGVDRRAVILRLLDRHK